LVFSSVSRLFNLIIMPTHPSNAKKILLDTGIFRSYNNPIHDMIVPQHDDEDETRKPRKTESNGCTPCIAETVASAAITTSEWL